MTYVYQTINTSEMAQQLLEDDNAGWSTNGAWALAEYLENFTEETETPLYFNVVDIRCDYTEYKDIEEFNEVYDKDYEFVDALFDMTTVIQFDGGFIVADF